MVLEQRRFKGHDHYMQRGVLDCHPDLSGLTREDVTGLCVQRGGRKGRESKWGKMLPQPKPTTANTLHVVKVFAKLCLFYNAYLLFFFLTIK